MTIALGLHALAGWGAAPGLAQGPTNNTFTESTSTTVSFESPPACSPVGSSRQVETITFELTVGPGCVVIGNRDVANFGDIDALCPTLPEGPPPTVPPGEAAVYRVAFGQTNTNTNTHTETFQCVAAVPALPWPALFGLGGALSGLGWWGMRRRAGQRA